LVKLSRVRAALLGRDFVTPEDVKAMAGPALAHRLVMKPEAWVQRIRGEQVIDDCLRDVPTPAAKDLVADIA
jgi:MoxR-like ATPase